MTVRKKAESENIFEDVIKRNDRIICFTIKIADDEIAAAQAVIDLWTARKVAAEALPK